MRPINLRSFDNRNFNRGRSSVIELLWLVTSALLVSSWLPGSAHRRLILRAFGAKIGDRVAIKPRVHVKFPWRLTVGDDSWIGEGVWIDNLAPVEIGGNCCISQSVYLCTGSHDWSSSTFDLIVKPITIEGGAWIAARAVICPGVTIAEGCVLTAGSVATDDCAKWKVHQGNPAVAIRDRRGAVSS
ncbi:MAG: WcaF family extracellular polysaccharide biosynthesis acetyltransferase [Hyphomicrobium sp.]